MSGDLIVERHAGYDCWVLDRPARRNAVGLGLLGELAEALRSAVEAGTTVAVLGARGPVFCAGFDLDDLRRIHAEGGALSSSPLHDLLDRFSPPSLTLITAIQGPAYGGGVELALLGDLRVASPSATFLLPPARHGILYPERGLRRLSAALGPSLLRAMLVSALPVDAARLHQSGALWALSEDPLATAHALAAQIAALPAAARLGNAALVR